MNCLFLLRFRKTPKLKYSINHKKADNGCRRKGHFQSPYTLLNLLVLEMYSLFKSIITITSAACEAALVKILDIQIRQIYPCCIMPKHKAVLPLLSAKKPCVDK